MLGGGYVFAGGAGDFPEVFVASYVAENGIAQLVVDWNQVPSDDDRQFGLYRSVGENADKYSLVMTLTPGVSMYTDSGLNVDTEYHYIIGGALPRKTLPETKTRGQNERRTERSTPRAALSYGNAPGSPIAWVPPEETSTELVPPADTGTTAEALFPLPQPNDNQLPPPQTGYSRSPEIAEVAPSPAVPPYEPTRYFMVPEREPALGNGGVFFTMGYFSNRLFQLTGPTREPVMVNLFDSNVKSRLLSLFRQSYARATLPGTSLYYALHNAINQIDRWDASGALSGFDTVFLVTITDGLDTSSTDPALTPINGVAFNNALSYQNFIRNSIENRQTGAQKITAVSVGIRGTDLLSEQEYTTALRSAATAEDNVYRIPLYNLTKILQDIAASATSGAVAHPFGFITPTYPDGTEIFIALDGFSTPPRGQNFISGQVRIRGGHFILENITLGGSAQEAGPAPTDGIVGRAEPNGGVEWLFNFPEPLNPSRVIHYYKPGKDWRNSKEFALRIYPPVGGRHSSLVYLLIDNSVSMSNQNIAAVRDSVAKFIEALSVVPANVQPVFSSDQSFVMTQIPERAVVSELAVVQPQPQQIPSPPPANNTIEPARNVRETPPSLTRDVNPQPSLGSTPPAPALPAVPQPIPGSKGYWVQASSSENRNIAEEIITQLKQYQLAPVISEAQVRGKTFYRVRIGPYATLADASTVADFVKQPPLGFYDSFVP